MVLTWNPPVLKAFTRKRKETGWAKNRSKAKFTFLHLDCDRSGYFHSGSPTISAWIWHPNVQDSSKIQILLRDWRNSTHKYWKISLPFLSVELPGETWREGPGFGSSSSSLSSFFFFFEFLVGFSSCPSTQTQHSEFCHQDCPTRKGCGYLSENLSGGLLKSDWHFAVVWLKRSLSARGKTPTLCNCQVFQFFTCLSQKTSKGTFCARPGFKNPSLKLWSNKKFSIPSKDTTFSPFSGAHL